MSTPTSAAKPAPLLVGLFFSLGHSTVVGLMCLFIALGSQYLSSNVENLKDVLAPVGTFVSVVVLLLVAVLNMVTAKDLFMQYHERRVTGEHKHYSTFGGRFFTHDHEVEIDEDAKVKPSTATPGLMTRCCPNIFKGITEPWQMYPIGFLFGLGFDTASEIALLGLTAMSSDSSSGVPPLLTLILPALFASAMSLIDTLDGMMMLFMYSWAKDDPARRLFFNLFLTALSAGIALVVAIVEILGRVQDHWDLEGAFWSQVKFVNDHFEYVGYSIIGVFVASCACASVYMAVVLGKEGGEGDGGAGGDLEDARIVEEANEKAKRDAAYLRKRMLDRATGREEIKAIDI